MNKYEDNLEWFFTCYFSQDFEGTTKEIVNEFLSENSGEYILEVLNSLNWLLNKRFDNETLHKTLYKLGSAYHAPSFGETYKQWLIEIYNQIAEHLGKATIVYEESQHTEVPPSISQEVEKEISPKDSTFTSQKTTQEDTLPTSEQSNNIAVEVSTKPLFNRRKILFVSILIPILIFILGVFVLGFFYFYHNQYDMSLNENKGAIESVAFSPDGKLESSASKDGIRLWDEKGNLKKILTGDGGWMYSVAFSPDGKTIAGASDSIFLWDLGSGSLIRSFRPNDNTHLSSLAISPDGLLIAGGCFSGNAYNNSVKIWQAGSGVLKETLKEYSDGVNSVAFSPDGKTIMSTSGIYNQSDNTIKLWDVSSGKLKQTLKGHNCFVFSAAFSPDGKLVASVSCDKKIKIWDTNSGDLIKTITGSTENVVSVAFSPSGETIATGDDENNINLWDTNSGILKQTLKGHTQQVRTLVFSPDGKTIMSGSLDSTVKLWHIG